MFSGPMFRREYQAATRGRRPFLFRTVFAVVLVLVAAAIGLVLYTANTSDSAETKLLYFGRSLVIAAIAIELMFLVFFVPAQAGGAIAEEREKNTLPLLLLTWLTPVEIVLTKVVARWLPVANLVFTGLPAIVAGAWAAGLEREAILTLLVLLSSSAFMVALAIATSAHFEQVATARGLATMWICLWLLGPPFLTIMPIATGSLWNDLLVELKRVCTLVAPSSPLSLATDNGWYFRSPGAIGLEGRVAIMIALQTLFGLLATAFATSRVQPREKSSSWSDPTRGHRPACGDDPIYWREFELPMRRGAGWVIAIRLRFVWILIRAVLWYLLSLVGAMFAVAVPIGLLVATFYFGFGAFDELWHQGYGIYGPFEARAQFNLLIRAATALLALLPAIGAASLVTTRITTERDKQTWDAFLTTPLSAAEILRSKARAAVHFIWHSAWPIPILWAAGLACGVVLPLGVALAAIDLLLLVWASVALGLYLGIRPGTTSAASNRSALVTMAFFVFHTLLLGAALASPRELAKYAPWDARLRWLVAMPALAILVLTGAVALFLTRRTLARFDEWVGRPVAGRGRGQYEL